MTPRPSADGRVRRACPLPGSDTVLGMLRARADACALGDVPSTDPEAEPPAAVGEAVLCLLLQYRVCARARSLLVYGSERLFRLVGLLAQLPVGSLPAGGLALAGMFPRQSQVPWRSET